MRQDCNDKSMFQWMQIICQSQAWVAHLAYALCSNCERSAMLYTSSLNIVETLICWILTNADTAKTSSINSCLCPVASLDGELITTIEGLGNSSAGFSKVQGKCTQGKISWLYSILSRGTCWRQHVILESLQSIAQDKLLSYKNSNAVLFKWEMQLFPNYIRGPHGALP